MRSMLKSYFARELPTHNGNRSTKTPTELSTLNLFFNAHTAFRRELIAKPKKCVHEGEVETPLWTIFQFFPERLVAAPARGFPTFRARADFTRERRN